MKFLPDGLFEKTSGILPMNVWKYCYEEAWFGDTGLFATGNYLGKKARCKRQASRFDSGWYFSTSVCHQPCVGIAGPDDRCGCGSYSFAVACCAARGDIDIQCAAVSHSIFAEHVVFLCWVVCNLPGILYAVIRALWADTEP
jgi:hypothetical protein